MSIANLYESIVKFLFNYIKVEWKPYTIIDCVIYEYVEIEFGTWMLRPKNDYAIKNITIENIIMYRLKLDYIIFRWNKLVTRFMFFSETTKNTK